MFDFLRKTAEVIYITPGLNKEGKNIAKIGYTGNVDQRAAAYRSNGIDTDLSNNKQGDCVDEILMKIYYVNVKKVPVDSYSRTSFSKSKWNPWSNKQDPWFDLSDPKVLDVFKNTPLNEVYSNVELDDIYWSDLFTLPVNIKNTIDQYIDYSVLSKKSVAFWRVMFTKCKKDLDTFYKILDEELVECFENFFDNKEDLLVFKKLYIKFLTTYDNELRNGLRRDLYNMIEGC